MTIEIITLIVNTYVTLTSVISVGNTLFARVGKSTFTVPEDAGK